ncbi:hypothetical protein DGG96_00875 [Legionella qingyii]|uniref:Substrate of the Dot/Icm secretion system n=1 Tax=Legionella qingyii TaxID=2184757 RepID=A0A317UBE5_9GAMM|nr:hypothetical protein [Legionella qingyii]PWY57680.1 hypothetical protein DGG96_00875 [Legionella qingyii]RUR25853.1 hypothetical protein ELY20_01515 [Legionella qingyii]RUR29242.1 hypothetical protein ELY16_00140 [Legionella qingyii]
MTLEKDEELRKKSLAEYEILQWELEEKLKTAMKLPTNLQKLHSALEAANKAAYDAYINTYDSNNAKSDEAYEECLKTQEALREKHKEDGELYQQGEISEEEYDKRHQEYIENHERTYEKYKASKEENDEASKKAYRDYKEICENNKKKVQSAQEAQRNMEDSPSLSAPSGSVTNPAKKIGAALDQLAETQKRSAKIQSENTDELLKAFDKKLGSDDWYKQNPPKKDKDGNLSMTFKSDKDMTEFFQDHAKEGNSFLMVDEKTNKVIAFSNGDGKLYKPGPDGSKQEFTGGSLFPSAEELKSLPEQKDFQMPQKQEESNMQLN